MSDIHDLHPQKLDAQEKFSSKKAGTNESDRTAVLKAKLQALLSEHRDLDDVIAQLTGPVLLTSCDATPKKRKLALKDEIARLHALVLPDIIA